MFFSCIGFARKKLDNAIKGVHTPAITSSPKVPPLLQVAPEYHAVRTDSLLFCFFTSSASTCSSYTNVVLHIQDSLFLTFCNVFIDLAGNLFPSSSTLDTSGTFNSLANDILVSSLSSTFSAVYLQFFRIISKLFRLTFNSSLISTSDLVSMWLLEMFQGSDTDPRRMCDFSNLEQF